MIQQPPHLDNLSVLIPTTFPALVSEELCLWLAQVDAQLSALCLQQSLAPAEPEQVMLLGKKYLTDFGGESSCGKLEHDVLQVTSASGLN